MTKNDPGDVWVVNPGGRVVSVKADSEAAQKWPHTTAPDSEPVKRGPGRPRKNPEPEAE